MSEPISGDRVRLLRTARQLSQSDLATAIGVSGNGVLSKIENGRTAVVDTDIWSALADYLDCSPDLLARTPDGVNVTRPWLRAYADARVKVVDAVVADNKLHHELTGTLGLKRISAVLPEFTGDVNDPDDIETYAADARAEARVDDDAVVKNMIRAAERLGCVILPLDGELNRRHLGMSQYVGGIPYIRVSRPHSSSRQNIPGDRQRFTVAHELGHLGLHADLSPPQTVEDAARIEKQAHRFAGAFLVPAEALAEDLDVAGGRVTLKTLSTLKAKWGVAVKALVVRFQQLGVVSDDHAVSLYKQISARGWNTNEPVDVTNETPVWFARAMTKVAGSGTDLSAWAEQNHGLGPTFVNRWLDWTGDTCSSDGGVVHLDSHRPDAAHAGDARPDSPGSVVHLTARRIR